MSAAGVPKNPFVREGHVDKPGIVGSHWWNRQLGEATALRSRRALITALAVGAAGVWMFGMLAVSLVTEDTRDERRPSLDMQRVHGWSFGAASETVAFDTLFTTTYAADALPRLAADLQPKNQLLLRWFIPTLFQSPTAMPRVPLPEETTAPLSAALKPIHTPTMTLAEQRARALAQLLAEAGPGRVAIVFDLDGPESVAAAAGAADHFDPVFLFDNWPHPRGVVPAHMTLAAAVYHQPRFVQAAAARSGDAPPAFVLDRKRLSPYSDEATQFDNRWMARLPSAADLRSLEIKRVLYVVATQASPIDLRDVAQALFDWHAAGLDVRALALDSFESSAPGSKVYFGGTPEAHAGFFAHYPWKAPVSPAPAPVAPKGPPSPLAPDRPAPQGASAAVPVPRNDEAARFRPSAPSIDPADSALGTILVTVDKESSRVVGPALLRSGSWNRSSGGWGGG